MYHEKSNKAILTPIMYMEHKKALENQSHPSHNKKSNRKKKRGGDYSQMKTDRSKTTATQNETYIPDLQSNPT